MGSQTGTGYDRCCNGGLRICTYACYTSVIEFYHHQNAAAMIKNQTHDLVLLSCKMSATETGLIFFEYFFYHNTAAFEIAALK